jgi:dTDP-4-dehydrorhamnose reductase
MDKSRSILRHRRKKLERALVLGSTGLLGSHVASLLKSKYKVSGTHLRNPANPDIESHKIDITNFNEIEELIRTGKFHLIINCIGLTNIEECDRRPEAAWQINATLPFYLAKASHLNDVKFIHISTDHYSSDMQQPRSEDVKFIPLNHYGYSKISGEGFVTQENPSALVLRTNFFGLSRKSNHSLLDFLVQKLLRDEPFEGFEDVIFNPLGVTELSRLILKLADTSLNGIFHTAGERPVSKYEFAVEVAACLNITPTRLTKGSMKSIQTWVKRPNYLALDSTKLQQNLGIIPKSMSAMLREELKTII